MLPSVLPARSSVLVLGAEVARAEGADFLEHDGAELAFRLKKLPNTQIKRGFNAMNMG